MRDTQNNIGLDGYAWFFGVVENRNDPLKLGRCQVRVFTWHTGDKALIPTEDLPWAHPEIPLGKTDVEPPVEGTWVRGYFLDVELGQFPVISHSLPGMPEITPPRIRGFSDQRSDEVLQSSPRPVDSLTYNTDGSGIEITEKDAAERFPFNLNESSLPRLSRNEKIDQTIVQTKKDSKVTGVQTAKGDMWDEPDVPYNAVYPFNHVTETESGHIVELDDTPDNARIHIFHRNGTFIEMHPKGDVVIKTSKSKYEIVMADDRLYIMGNSSITIQGNSELYVQKDASIKIDGNNVVDIIGNQTSTIGGDQTSTIQGDATDTITGNETRSIKKTSTIAIDEDYNLDVQGSISESTNGDITTNADGSIDVTSSSSVVYNTPSFRVNLT